MTWENIKPVDQQGRVALEGTVEWQYQREAAENAVRHLRGVTSVHNSITVKPKVQAGDIKHSIEDAFRRIAQVDADHITVDARGSDVCTEANGASRTIPSEGPTSFFGWQT